MAKDKQNNGLIKIYNQFPRCYKNIKKMQEQLVEIATMGFNCVWINPIQKASPGSPGIKIERLNKYTGKKIKVKSSLYAMYDPERLESSLIDSELSQKIIEESDFDPGKCSEVEKNTMKAYTNQAMDLGLIPIFDLVMNHISLDSPITTGKCKFSQVILGKGIDTTKWFQSTADKKWDDIVCFDYINYKDFEQNRTNQEITSSDMINYVINKNKIEKEIVEYFWKPFIKKYIVDFGFRGVRVDFATGYSKEVQIEIIKYINDITFEHHKMKPIIFAEVLPPPKVAEFVYKNYKGVGYTHVTNSFLWLGMENFEPLMQDRGRKQQLVFSKVNDIIYDDLRGGTIGFCGSHDEGPTWRVVENHFSRDLKNLKQDSVRERQKNIIEPEKIKIEEMGRDILEKYIKKRIAMVALLSDGGFYLLSGDEFGDRNYKDVFLSLDGDLIYNETEIFEKKDKPYNFCSFIRNVNDCLASMPRSNFFFWCKMLFYKESLLVILRHNEQELKYEDIELVIVNITNNSVTLENHDLETIISDFPDQKIKDELKKYNKELNLIGDIKNNTKKGAKGFNITTKDYDDEVLNKQINCISSSSSNITIESETSETIPVSSSSSFQVKRKDHIVNSL